jgi:ribonuclease T1
MRRILLVFGLLCLALIGPAHFGLAQARQPHDNRPVAATATAIEWITAAELPPEARHTLQLIQQGGPYPYPRDGVVFHNRERHLPAQARGYYREYTVPTPGIHHRGARRIVSGAPDERYYTADHYRSFRRIRP